MPKAGAGLKMTKNNKELESVPLSACRVILCLLGLKLGEGEGTNSGQVTTSALLIFIHFILCRFSNFPPCLVAQWTPQDSWQFICTTWVFERQPRKPDGLWIPKPTSTSQLIKPLLNWHDVLSKASWARTCCSSKFLVLKSSRNKTWRC